MNIICHQVELISGIQHWLNIQMTIIEYKVGDKAAMLENWASHQPTPTPTKIED